MCGIFGCVFTVDSLDVEKGLRSIAHRGPDANGVFRRPGVVLGHNRLAILDLSEAGTQPMVSADGAVAVVFNGEIYNHHRLREDLEKAGHTFRSRTDTEVILEGYRAWKDGIVERLDGMFAFAVYDHLARRVLVARDRAGKKPLFFAKQGTGWAFASEIKALLAAGVPAEMDPQALPSLLVHGYVEPPRTMYRGIEQLPPATLMVLEEGRPPIYRRYWRPPFAAPRLELSVDDACAELVRLMNDAVTRRLESDVPLGAFLSGGIDSTIIVGLMARALGRKVKTFSIGFSGDARFDETHYARVAARAFDTEHTEFVVEPDALTLLDDLVYMHDAPFGDSSAVPTSIVSMLTRQKVTVAMTGDGGDELFCGYSRFLAVEASEHIPRPLAEIGRFLAGRIPERGAHESRPEQLRRFVARAGLPLAERLLGYCSYFAWDLGALIRPGVATPDAMAAPLAFDRQVVEESAGGTRLSRVLHHNFETYLPHDLLVKADRSSMMHSLELRSPFLDTRLVEFAARLPDSYLRRGRVRKWILRQAFADLIPHEILHRSKMGFGAPLGSWFRGDLKSFVCDYLGDSARVWSVLERPFVTRLLDEHFAGRRDEGMRIWLLLTLESWMRQLGQKKGG